jgi:hypothetical protein
MQAVVLGNMVQAVVVASVTALLICYLLLLPWSRKALFAAVPLGAISATLGLPAYSGSQVSYYLGAALGRSIFLLLFLLLAYRSARNKLAFKIEVPDAELAKYYDTYLANPAARRALAYGVASLIMPLLIPFALAFGVRGLKRAQPDAWPPAGKRSAAIRGLVFTGLSVVIWSVVIMDLTSKNHG